MAQRERDRLVVLKKAQKKLITEVQAAGDHTGDFDFDGVTYQGTYEPIVSRELWEQVQLVLIGRGARKTRKMKENFAFSGLLSRGHCGCAMVGDLKKGPLHVLPLLALSGQVPGAIHEGGSV
jgi:hypothetical protein